MGWRTEDDAMQQIRPHCWARRCGDRGSGQSDRGEHVVVERPEQLLVGDLERTSSGWPARVRHDDVDPAPVLQGRVDQRRRHRRIGHVPGHDDGVGQAGGQLVERGGVACVEDQLGALVGKSHRSGATQTLRGARDDGDASSMPRSISAPRRRWERTSLRSRRRTSG